MRHTDGRLALRHHHSRSPFPGLCAQLNKLWRTCLGLPRENPRRIDSWPISSSNHNGHETQYLASPCAKARRLDVPSAIDELAKRRSGVCGSVGFTAWVRLPDNGCGRISLREQRMQCATWLTVAITQRQMRRDATIEPQTRTTVPFKRTGAASAALECGQAGSDLSQCYERALCGWRQRGSGARAMPASVRSMTK